MGRETDEKRGSEKVVYEERIVELEKELKAQQLSRGMITIGNDNMYMSKYIHIYMYIYIYTYMYI
jgi:hypothetical protein